MFARDILALRLTSETERCLKTSTNCSLSCREHLYTSSYHAALSKQILRFRKSL